MFTAIIVWLFLMGRFLKLTYADPPPDWQFLNLVRDPAAEAALLEFFHNSEPFAFKETNFFQPQCLLSVNISGEVCFGYKGGSFYGIAPGTINTVRLITNLPYIYSLGENTGASFTTVYTIATLREDLVIPYRTLSRFKGITTLDPVVMNKVIVLRLCMICASGDRSEHSLTVAGSVNKLTIRLFINEISANANNGILLDGNKRARINCETRNVTLESVGDTPDESPCSYGSCLGSEYCLTYQPEYSSTRETWCPLTERNWIASPENVLKLSSSDSVLPLHIQMERILLNERPFTLVLNPHWFIDYMGVLTLSIPEAAYTPSPYSIWKLVLPSTDRQPANQRIVLLYNCSDVQIQYAASDREFLRTKLLFMDMKSNFSFSLVDNLEQARRLCNPAILLAVGNNYSTTSETGAESTTRWQPTGYGPIRHPSCVVLMLFLFFLSTV